MRGLPGAVAALFGLCLMPVVLIMVMGFFYFRFKEVPAVKGVLHGASAAAVALTLAMVIQTGRKCLTGLMPVLLFLATFVLNGLVRWPLPLVLLDSRAAQPDLGVAEGAVRMMTHLPATRGPVRIAVAAVDRRRQRGAARNASAGGAGSSLDDRLPVRRHLLDLPDRARPEHSDRDAGRLRRRAARRGRPRGDRRRLDRHGRDDRPRGVA